MIHSRFFIHIFISYFSGFSPGSSLHMVPAPIPRLLPTTFQPGYAVFLLKDSLQTDNPSAVRSV